MSNNQYVASDGSSVVGISPADYEAYLSEKNDTPPSATDFVDYSGQDDSSYTPPSPVSSVPDKYSGIPSGVTTPEGGKASPAYEPPAPVDDGINPDFVNYSGQDDDSSYTPPAQPTNMAEVIAQQMANAESQGQTLETVPVPVPGGTVRPVREYSDSGDDSTDSYTPPATTPSIPDKYSSTPSTNVNPITGGTYAPTYQPSEIISQAIDSSDDSSYFADSSIADNSGLIFEKGSVIPQKESSASKFAIQSSGLLFNSIGIGGSLPGSGQRTIEPDNPDDTIKRSSSEFIAKKKSESADSYIGDKNWSHANIGSKYDSDPTLRKISSQDIADLVQEDRAGLYFPTSLEEARNILGDSDLTFSDKTTQFYNEKGENIGYLGESAFPYALVISEIAGEKPLLYFNTGGVKGNKDIDYSGKTSWIDTPSAKTMADQGTINDYILTSTSKNLDKPELTKDLSRKGINESWYDGIIGSAFDASNTGLGFSEALDESGNVDSNRMLEAFGTDDISKVIFGKPTLDLETERKINVEANKPRDNVEYLTSAQKAELKDKWSNPGYQFYDKDVKFAEVYNPKTGQYDTKPLQDVTSDQIRGYLGEDAIPYAIAHDYDDSGNLIKNTYLFATGKEADRIARAQDKSTFTNVPTKYAQTDSLGFTVTNKELDAFDISKSLGLDYDTTTPEQRKNELLSGYYDPQFLIVDSSGKTFVGDNLDRMSAESESEKRIASQTALQQNLTDSGYSLLVADEKGNVKSLSDAELANIAKSEYDALTSGKETYLNYGDTKSGIKLSNTESLKMNPDSIAQIFKSMSQVQLDEYQKSQQTNQQDSLYDMFIGSSKSASKAISDFVETDMFKQGAQIASLTTPLG
ncbi:MAG: hypothetical protein M0R51_11010, partial [Clostridia bacterium]|nr:hypothetical protein [Clostridia bacterium]